MKPKKHTINLKHQRAIALKLAGKKKGHIPDYANMTEQQLKLQYAVLAASKGNLIHVDNMNPADIVKANPRPEYTGQFTLHNTGLREETTVPDQEGTEDDWFRE